jgi:SAM-dependent methyltransferase
MGVSVLLQISGYFDDFLRALSSGLEIGPGDCSVALEAARRVRECIVVDVSTEITRKAEWPDNFHLIISDGSSVPVPEGSVDIAYSNQLMEHLHPDDARQQLVNVQRALKPGGRYICRTPNRLSGPHDISRYFDETATGFHLREYTLTELAKVFRDVGFAHLGAFVVVRGRFLPHPLAPVLTIEWILEHLPRRLCRPLAASRLIQLALGVNLVGRK